MLRKSWLICVLFIMVWALSGTNAFAYPASATGVWGGFLKCVCIYSDWVGVGNYEVKPTDVEVTLELLEVRLHYLNPSGKPGGLGEAFYPDAEVTGEQAASGSITKNGKFHSEICFTDDELYAGIDEALIPLPPNPQWTLDLEGHYVRVYKMYVTIRGYSDFDGDIGHVTETETSHLAGTCTLNEKKGTYECGTEHFWNYKNSDPDCPFE